MLARHALLVPAGAGVAQVRHKPCRAFAGRAQQDELGRESGAVLGADLDLSARRQRVDLAGERLGEKDALRVASMLGEDRVDEVPAGAVVRGEREGGLGGGAGLEDAPGVVEGEDHVGRGQHGGDERRGLALRHAPLRGQLAHGQDA